MSEVKLNPTVWYPLRQNLAGLAYSRSLARFNTVPAGRRSGKTLRAKRKWVRRAIRFGIERPDIHDGYFVFGAPTLGQAERIFWADLKAMVPRELVEKVQESKKIIRLTTGVELACIGLEKPERHEGRAIDGGVLDEYGNMRPEVWSRHLRPALSTPGRLGGLDFTGVPEGRNHYFDLHQFAMSDESGPNWAGFTWTSEEILSPDEIAAAKRDLDELTYQQEYLASFVTFQGRAYYAFDHDIHTDQGLPYYPNQPLILCFDFNRSPGVAVVAQENVVGGEVKTCVIGEVWIENNSNTPRVCQEIIRQWGRHEGRVIMYGDATGGAKTSSSIMGSDWELIHANLYPVFGERLTDRVGRTNPPERVRVNSVNSRLRSVDGTSRLIFDASKAPKAIQDFDGVRAKDDGSVDKSDLKLSHISDALGYYIAEQYPIEAYTGYQTSEVVY